MVTEGEVLRDVAIGRVHAANDDWVTAALAVIKVLATGKQHFTTDEVHALMNPMRPPKEPRAMGAAMARARAEGWVERTSVTAQSERPECHRRPVRVWKSMIWSG